MYKVWIGTLAAALFVSTALAADTVPKDWILSGDSASDYVANVDHATVHGGKASAHYKSRDDHPKEFGTLMQVCDATAFRGKRVVFSAFVKTTKVAGWTGLWLRVDGNKDEVTAFDNMEDRPIKANSDWKQYSVVLDVSKDAKDLAYGILVAGAGETWIDDVKLEVAPKGMAVTGKPVEDERPHHTPLPQPSNLDFEH